MEEKKKKKFPKVNLRTVLDMCERVNSDMRHWYEITSTNPEKAFKEIRYLKNMHATLNALSVHMREKTTVQIDKDTSVSYEHAVCLVRSERNEYVAFRENFIQNKYTSVATQEKQLSDKATSLQKLLIAVTVAELTEIELNEETAKLIGVSCDLRHILLSLAAFSGSFQRAKQLTFTRA